ncbi:MAG: helix-turn-helix transcriptional regulator [Clostridia bacterium]|nr:helix-turn-helix transcriptional regulator [Clostridia bacterium]
MDSIHVLGANIRAYRLCAGLSQEELAEKANLHRTYVGAIERGDRNVSLKNIEKLATALNVETYKLLILPSNKEE